MSSRDFDGGQGGRGGGAAGSQADFTTDNRDVPERMSGDGGSRSAAIPHTPASPSFASERNAALAASSRSAGLARGDLQQPGNSRRAMLAASARKYDESSQPPATPRASVSDSQSGGFYPATPSSAVSRNLRLGEDGAGRASGRGGGARAAAGASSSRHGASGTQGDDEEGATGTQSQTQPNTQPVTSSSSFGAVSREQLLYGTTVAVERTMALVRDFIHSFRLSTAERMERQEQRMLLISRGVDIPDALAEELDPPLVDDHDGSGEGGEGEEGGGGSAEPPYYLQILEELAETHQAEVGRHLYVGVDAKHIYSFTPDGPKLYSQLIRYPQEIIPIMDMVIGEELAAILARPGIDDTSIPPAVRVRIFNLRDPKRMRMLDPIDIDTLVSVRGMVIRTSEVIPDMKVGYFRCSNCGFGRSVEVENGRLEEPAMCGGCNTRHSMALLHNRCTFIDKQMIKLQETPESIPEGETPMTIVLYAFEDLVDAVVPGDRVQVTGVFRAVGTRPNPKQRNLRSVFRTYLDVNNFQKAESSDRISSMDPHKSAAEYSNDGQIQAESTSAAEKRAKACTEMAEDPDLYSKLANSLAPSIWELDDVKKGVLLQLFGGVNKDLGREGKIRGEINVLLCGDPGTSKSQLLTYVHKIAPRGMYTSGTGSSAVGLTAYITKDPESKEPVLESGALVLSDRGVCCIDEFDKMSDATRSILHEVMEQQTVSIAKAGIICTLNARTSVLASANPVESRYNPNLSVVENIQLPPTLLSRFDLIYLILDNVNADSDRRLAQHLVSLHWPEAQREAEAAASAAARGIRGAAIFERKSVMEYISYAKEVVNPVLSDEANDALVAGYMDMRRLGAIGRAGGKKTITATTRQLESLIRLSEAHARMRLSDVVEVSDVQEAIRLMNVATQRAAIDPRTGTINMELITTGHSSLERDAVSVVAEEIRDALEDRALSGAVRSMTINELIKILDKNNGGDMPLLSRATVVEALRELASEDNSFVAYDGKGERFRLIAAGRRSGGGGGAGGGAAGEIEAF